MCERVLHVPDDYRPGYERARDFDPELASRYISNTTIGDPMCDRLVEQLLPHYSQGEIARLLVACVEMDRSALRAAPQEVRDFFEELDFLSEQFDRSVIGPGITAFHRNSKLIIMAHVSAALVEGFATSIAKPFFISGRLRDQGVRRLKQNNRQLIEIFLPGGLERHGDGRRLSIRVRLVHAFVRSLLEAPASGIPTHGACPSVRRTWAWPLPRSQRGS